MKKIIACVLTVILFATLLPTSAFAETEVLVSSAAELISALGTGGNIKLDADIDAGELERGAFFTVNKEVTVTLDLNGYTLEGTRSGVGNTSIILNRGTLTIKDSAGGGQIVIDALNDDGWSSCTAPVFNSGTMTLESGTLLNRGGTSMAYALDNLSNGLGIFADLTMKGGTLRSENYIGLRLFANSTGADFCKATIEGGSIFGQRRGIWIQQANTHNNEAVLTITGGRIEGVEQSAVMVDLLGEDGVDISISGGEFINHSVQRATLALMQEVEGAGGCEVTISGGVFLNTGSAGNLSIDEDDTTSKITVTKGTFSVPVPDKFIAEGADIKIGTDSQVTANAEVAFIIEITPSVDFGDITRSMGILEKNFTVSVKDALLEDGAKITVTNSTGSDNMIMWDKDGAGSNALPFSLEQSVFTFEQDDLVDGGRTITSSVRCDPKNLKAAGSYKGYMTFTVSYGN